MPLRLTPESGDDEERMPLGFEAIDDITAGDTYVDENGTLLTPKQLQARMQEMPGPKRIVRVKLRYRLKTDPVEMELRTTYVNVPVFGRMTPELLAQAVHHATRNCYDALRNR